MTTQGTLLLGGAVILSAIGIIGLADVKQLEQHQTKCCHVLNKSLEMMMNDLQSIVLIKSNRYKKQSDNFAIL